MRLARSGKYTPTLWRIAGMCVQQVQIHCTLPFGLAIRAAYKLRGFNLNALSVPTRSAVIAASTFDDGFCWSFGLGGSSAMQSKVW
jgi:hypothetical protein